MKVKQFRGIVDASPLLVEWGIELLFLAYHVLR